MSLERDSPRRDERVGDAENRFRRDGDRVLRQQVVAGMNGSREGVLDRHGAPPGATRRDGVEEILEAGTGERLGVLDEVPGGLFAEGSGNPLVGDRVRAHSESLRLAESPRSPRGRPSRFLEVHGSDADARGLLAAVARHERVRRRRRSFRRRNPLFSQHGCLHPGDRGRRKRPAPSVSRKRAFESFCLRRL